VAGLQSFHRGPISKDLRRSIIPPSNRHVACPDSSERLNKTTRTAVQPPDSIPLINMKRKGAVLEYKVAKQARTKARKWGFTFKTHGKTLVESAAVFDSYAKAQQGFLSMIKLIATNQYSITVPDRSDATSPP